MILKKCTVLEDGSARTLVGMQKNDIFNGISIGLILLIRVILDFIFG